MYEALQKIYQKKTEQERQLLMQDYYNFKFDKAKDVHMNVSELQNIVVKLKGLNEEISQNMLMSKILTILPEKLQYFSSAWDSTQADDKTLDNLISRLSLEEDKQGYPSMTNGLI
ncbi:uncharacterized protein LOC114882092 [Osmia bicornis bicornis]|uniref:uncharacterized protein LOC114882092 n=1 Tax=Osmia bicornis bicornis TaxID=1437191 RepID=UPI0010F5F408|nr:uncharacterized protein LOC114882092 [Osmia bicornis bicornis]